MRLIARHFEMGKKMIAFLKKYLAIYPIHTESYFTAARSGNQSRLVLD